MTVKECLALICFYSRWKWNGKKAFHLRDRRRFARQLKEEIDEAALAKLNSTNWDAIKAMSPEEFAGWCVTDLPSICAEGQSSRASITEWLKADGERKK